MALEPQAHCCSIKWQRLYSRQNEPRTGSSLWPQNLGCSFSLPRAGSQHFSSAPATYCSSVPDKYSQKVWVLFFQPGSTHRAEALPQDYHAKHSGPQPCPPRMLNRNNNSWRFQCSTIKNEQTSRKKINKETCLEQHDTQTRPNKHPTQQQ